MVIDAGRQAASVGAVVAGFAGHRDDVEIAGVIFNRVASAAHASGWANQSKELVGMERS